jgi:hypothetical protein
LGDLWLADDLLGEMMVVGSRWVKREEGCFGDYINERWLLGSSKDEKESQNLVIREKEREL